MDSSPSSPGRERSHLLALLRREARVPLLKFAALIGVAGLSNSLILALINSAASKVSEELDNARELLLFVVLMAAYVLAQRYVYRASITEIEHILDRLRTRLTDKIRKAEFSQFGRLSRSEIYAGVASEMTSLSQGAPVLVMGLQSSMLILFVTAYMASLSVVACQLTLFLGVLGLYFYLPRAQQARTELRQSQAGENRFIEVLGHMLDGFKEVRLHQPRSDDLFEHARSLSNQASLTKRNAYTTFSELNVFWQVGFYLLLGFTVFVLPRMVPSYSDAAVKTTAAILFLMSPLLGLVGAVPTLSQASVAAENIQKLEAMLDQRDGSESTEEGSTPRTSFHELRLEDVSFSYTDAQGRPTFRLGPASLTLHAGETLFIVGGNGSGKSTLLMLLTGLYRPASGTVLLDGEPVGPYNINSYRSLFATVFSDYHLFERLYGLRASPERIQEVLRYMELDGKTQVVDGRFKTLGLSSGQRKRLALAVTILEDRPICIFDEWAAEQDPDFRRHFYEDVLADLKKQGKTLIVVSHDDRYFDAKIIDRVVKVERGRFVPFRKDSGADESNDPSAR